MTGNTIKFIFVCATLLSACTLAYTTYKRVNFVTSEPGRHTGTTGGEAISTYNVYLCANGNKIYTDPRIYPLNCAMYNFGFYHTFAWIDRVFTNEAHWDPAKYRLVNAMLFLAIVISAALFTDPLLPTIRLIGRHGLFLVIALLFSIPYLSWWLFSCRPDLIAAGLSMLAYLLGAHVLGDRKLPPAKYLIVTCSALLFFAAWSFKQSTVFLYVFLVFRTFLSRRFAYSCILVAPMVIGIIVSFLVGGTDYYLNVVDASKTSSYRFLIAWNSTLSHLVKAVPLYVLFAGCLLLIRSKKEFLWQAIPVILFTFVVSVVASSRQGSSYHYFFEHYLIMLYYTACLTSKTETVFLPSSAGIHTRTIGVICLIFAMIATATTEGLKIFATGFGTLAPQPRITSTDIQIALEYQYAGHPVFVQDEWIAMNFDKPQIPGFILSDDIYYAANDYYMTTFTNLVSEKYFRTVIVLKGDTRFDSIVGMNPSYTKSRVTDNFNIYTLLAP